MYIPKFEVEAVYRQYKKIVIEAEDAMQAYDKAAQMDSDNFDDNGEEWELFLAERI